MCRYSANLMKNTITISRVLNRMKCSGLRLNKHKCEFRRTTLNFLGHVSSMKGICASPEKVEAIRKLKPSTNVKELMRLLGMINFIARFVPKAQENLSPLIALLKKYSSWLWQEPQINAFETIKDSLKCHNNSILL